jgi:hypothetical protein
MAFSFTPGQITPQGSQSLTPPGAVTPGALSSPVSGPPSDSPFLFIRERGQQLSVMACVQIVLVVVSILSVIICATLYSYSIYLQAQIDTKKADLASKEVSLPTYQYDEMRRLSIRMAALDKLLQNYISPRSPLKFLENVVENQVVFDKFQLSRDKKGSYSVVFTVVTTNYKALIQQLKALNLAEYSKVAPTPKLSDLNDSISVIKIQVTTPIFVQGKLPDEVVFFTDQSVSESTSTSVSSIQAGSLPTSGNLAP